MINLKRKIIILSLIFFVYLLFSCGRKNDGGIGDIRKIDLAGLSVAEFKLQMQRNSY